jgi:hypothetical protein
VQTKIAQIERLKKKYPLLLGGIGGQCEDEV